MKGCDVVLLDFLSRFAFVLTIAYFIYYFIIVNKYLDEDEDKIDEDDWSDNN